MKTISDRIFELLREQKMSQKDVLGVSLEHLLSGAEGSGIRSRENSMYVIMKDSELGQVDIPVR